MHRRTAIIGTVLTMVTALAALLVGATPAQATPVRSAVTTQARAATQTLFTSEVQHTSVAKTGGAVRERLVIHVYKKTMVENLRISQRLGQGRSRVVRGPVKLGWLSPGWHSWTWTGHDNRGDQVPDGYYDVHADTFTPSGNPASPPRPVTGRAFVHRHYYPGDLTSEYPALYPRSKSLHDSTILENRRPYLTRATLRVTNRAGKTVLIRAGKALRTDTRLRWDGRDARGLALPAGTYSVKVSGVDRDGLRGSTKALKVMVSAKRLVPATGTLEVSPAATRTPDYPFGCNGCGDIPSGCGTVGPSGRFAQEGALSYRTDSCEQDRGSASTRHVLLLHEVAPRGYGSASVSVFGGPTTPGASDQGALSIASDSRSTTVLTGPDTSDHTTTTPSLPIGGVDTYSYEDTVWGYSDGRPGVEWHFTTSQGASYDAATFTVRYDFMTPR